MKIAIVDDDRQMLQLYEEILSDGNDIVCCNDAISLLNLLFKEHFDLIIADLKMPQKSGDEMVDFIREGLADRNIPIIIVSGFIDEELRKHISVYPKISFVEKPVTEERLKKAIEDLS